MIVLGLGELLGSRSPVRLSPWLGVGVPGSVFEIHLPPRRIAQQMPDLFRAGTAKRKAKRGKVRRVRQTVSARRYERVTAR